LKITGRRSWSGCGRPIARRYAVSRPSASSSPSLLTLTAAPSTSILSSMESSDQPNVACG
jgi:hypothetical protein